MLALMIGTMFLLLFLGFPMMIPLIGGALVVSITYFSFSPVSLIQQAFSGIQPVALTAVPMFIFAADLMTRGEVADRLLNFVMSWVGHKRGGLPVATTAACTLFGAVSGSTQATVIAIGGPMRTRMLSAGYSDSFTTALVINASEIALLIPPSIAMIVYGVVNGVSVGELFIAGVGPGVLIFAMFSTYCWYVSHNPDLEKASLKDRLIATKKALLAFSFPVIIFGGIYSGKFSPTEAAAISVLYALILEMFVYKSIKWGDLPKIAQSTGEVTAIVFILVAVGQSFSWVISFAQIPQMILPAVLGEAPSELWVLCVITMAYFLGCMFVDPIVVIMVMSPIFKSAIVGIHPIFVGTLVTLQCAIGSGTPPFGCNIFTAMAVFKQRYVDTISGTLPFIILLLIATVLLIKFPIIALGLGQLAGMM